MKAGVRLHRYFVMGSSMSGSLLLTAFLFLMIGLSLGLLGGGGSILTVPALMFGLHLDPKTAIAASLVIVGSTSLFGACRYLLKQKLQWQTGLVFGMTGMAGAWVAARIARHLPAMVQLLILSVMMIATAVAMLRRSHHSTPKTLPPDIPARGIKTGATGFGVGCLTGLVGAGGGFIIVPTLVVLEGMEMPAAVATSLMVITLNCLAGIIGYQSHVALPVPLIALMAVLSMTGCMVGCLLMHRVRPDLLRRGFAWLMLVVAAYLVARQATLLPWA